MKNFTSAFKFITFSALSLVLLLAFQNCGRLETAPSVSAEKSDQTPSPLQPPNQKTGSCNKTVNLSQIEKPKGVFSSVLTDKAVKNATMQGGLIRVPWAEIETSKGNYVFDKIEARLKLLPPGKKWSLAIHGGWTTNLDFNSTTPGKNCGGTNKPGMALSMSPSYLELLDSSEPYSPVGTFAMLFRGCSVKMPHYWNSYLQKRLKLMIEAVAQNYKNDDRLQLVYVPQMTSNGVEGHFNGVDSSILLNAAGVATPEEFEEIWVEASLNTTKIVSDAFDNKAIAFEVHEIMSSPSIPEKIMNAFLKDPAFENRVGIAMWWISGKDKKVIDANGAIDRAKSDYQIELVDLIKNYTGDVYGQIIDSSVTPSSFKNNDYSTVFSQAKDLCMRYIEPWNYEFEESTNNNLMTDFNKFANDNF